MRVATTLGTFATLCNREDFLDDEIARAARAMAAWSYVPRCPRQGAPAAAVHPPEAGSS